MLALGGAVLPRQTQGDYRAPYSSQTIRGYLVERSAFITIRIRRPRTDDDLRLAHAKASPVDNWF